MGEMLFSLDRQNFRQCQLHFRGERQQEYYRGDFWIDDTPTIDVRSIRKTVGPFSIISQRSATNLFFRRTRQHIREDPTDLSILWFVKSGTIAFSNQMGSKIAESGQIAITRSMSPFLLECTVGKNGINEVLHISVPTHILRVFIPHDLSNGVFIRAELPEFRIAQRLLGDIFEDDGGLTDASARKLVEAALEIIGNGTRSCIDTGSRQTITDRRMDDIMRYIEVHLANPKLSTTMVADACGVSRRYISWLFRTKDTTFSDVIWEKRLAKAKSWLESTNPREISIVEIAYNVGFKSSAHFSRKFKRTYKTNPRDCRLANEAGAMIEPAA